MKLPLIPFSFVIDKWRWELFRGDTATSNVNKRWWQLRSVGGKEFSLQRDRKSYTIFTKNDSRNLLSRAKYQGVTAPVERTEHDFDPGAKYHIPDNTPYIR